MMIRCGSSPGSGSLCSPDRKTGGILRQREYGLRLATLRSLPPLNERTNPESRHQPWAGHLPLSTYFMIPERQRPVNEAVASRIGLGQDGTARITRMPGALVFFFKQKTAY